MWSVIILSLTLLIGSPARLGSSRRAEEASCRLSGPCDCLYRRRRPRKGLRSFPGCRTRRHERHGRKRRVLDDVDAERSGARTDDARGRLPPRGIPGNVPPAVRSRQTRIRHAAWGRARPGVRFPVKTYFHAAVDYPPHDGQALVVGMANLLFRQRVGRTSRHCRTARARNIA